jgi:tuftelin-interacting protein 11
VGDGEYDEDEGEEDVDMEDEEQEDDEEEEGWPTRGGLGLGAGKGLGFQSSTPGKSKEKEGKPARGGLGMGFGASKSFGFRSPAAQTRPQKSSDNGGTPLGKGFVPSSANVPILRDMGDEEVSTPRIPRPSAFSTPVSGNGRGGNKAQPGPTMNAGSFAARMMAKMGYKEGQGLGKEGQGRSGVIEVQLRPQGVGLGAVQEKSKQEKEEEKRQAKLKGEVYEDSDEERKKKARRPRTSGTSSAMSTPRRNIKPKYRTVEELQKAAPGLNIPEAFAPILDMTGPNQRLLTTSSGLLTPTAGVATESVEQAENKKLARRAQSDLSSFVEEWKNLQERKAYVEMQMIQQKQEIEESQPDLENIRKFSALVSGKVSEGVKENQWDPVFEALLSADDFKLSTDTETLSSIAVSAVHPFLRLFSDGWQPLQDPKLCGMAPQIFKIRHILGAATPLKEMSHADLNINMSRIRIKSTTPYESMIYKIIFPKIVSSINQSWNVHDPSPLLALLDAWEGLLPGFVRSQILDQAVVGKLNEAVSSWNPRKRRSHELPHLWLFPWLQYLPAHHADPKSSTGLVSDVKRKFRQLVDSWDFHKGVVPGLQQWREVLCPNPNNDHWTPLIMNHVIPSMSRFLRNSKNFIVDPQDQEPYIAALQGIFAWKDILKPRVVGQVIVETVFPMWHDVLHQWLTITGPNEEIGLWFQWWRDDVFPDEIKTLKSIQDEFDKGHDMINQALDLGPRAATELPAPRTQTTRPEKVKSPPAPITPKPPVVEEFNVRHRVEDWCIENDLHFLPEKKVLHDAGPLYRITAAGNGKNGVLVYFKGDNLMALQRVESEPVQIVWDNEDLKDILLGMAHHNVK